ncbi:MAG TPA: YciI family protein [Piscinibacter sp.]|uniref:YciI family protein n=1 Tax=Piscinibacter sp. TaxID=1903157 RepID=UPI001B5FFB8D|nr:YciI family protein [Piscinibacter sp.]MBP5989024.1 YciI family protein [Piscinibacter sp.]MBP6026256.1 YciI family protein [Piscinibacter sp.]HNJ82865.1 YciI family protein [Piscinibacter sp.]HNK19703.1 YciI family protein [Piscinibacter sp.]
MRYMIIVRATPLSEAGIIPDDSPLMAAMASYHEDLAKAGVLLDAAGLQPSSKGWRIRWSATKPVLTDGPFAETKELIAGYTVIQVRSTEEAMEWSRRFPRPFPAGTDCEIEVRRLYEPEDFAPGGR